MGVGTRYQRVDLIDAKGQPDFVKFSQMDVALIIVIVMLIATLLVGLAIAILGLAYHHHRRHLEHLYRTGSPTTQDPGTRVTVG
jgi:hypothetical protein